MLSILLRISNERGAVPNVAAPPPIHDGKLRRPTGSQVLSHRPRPLCMW